MTLCWCYGLEAMRRRRPVDESGRLARRGPGHFGLAPLFAPEDDAEVHKYQARDTEYVLECFQKYLPDRTLPQCTVYKGCVALRRCLNGAYYRSTSDVELLLTNATGNHMEPSYN